VRAIWGLNTVLLGLNAVQTTLLSVGNGRDGTFALASGTRVAGSP